jgi:hypothetical protein
MTAPDPVTALWEKVAGVLAVEFDRLGISQEYDEPRHLTDALLAHLAQLVEARERMEALAVTALLESDALTPVDPETLRPETYYVEAENLGYLVGIVANALTSIEEES